MDKLSYIIVEDEIPSVEELKFLLDKYEFLSVKDVANDAKTALQIINKKNPDVVFLDINIPLGNGLELAKKIRNINKNIDIIFITAYEEYAIKAFEIEVLDYILKPFDEERINITISRLKNKMKSKTEKTEKLSQEILKIMTKLENKESELKKISCEINDKIILIDIDDIYFCYIEDKTYIKLKNKNYQSNYTLNEIEKKTGFFRAHRSYLINLNKIRELYPWFNGGYKLIVNDDQNSEIPLSRKNVKKLKEILGL